MILADKIINERKKNGWSQEELAEKLSVSRQSVSKWEGALAVPDLQKILLMSELFGVSTDYLLKDEIEPENITATTDSENDFATSIKVSLEEANAFIRFKAWSLPKIALGVLLCVTGPVMIVLLAGLSEANLFGLSENLASGIGIAFLFLQIALAVIIFIVVDEKGKKFKYIETKGIDTEYGVVGLARELKEKYQHKYTVGLIVGACLCLFGSLPIVFAALAEAKDLVIIVMVDVLLLAIGAASFIFIVVCGTMGTYNMLLQERDYTRKNKVNSKKIAPFNSIYWLLTTAVFLGYSFLTQRWSYSWVIFAVAGVLFPVYNKIVKLSLKIEDEEE